MLDWKNGRNHCYTYFKITGDFNPDEITEMIGLSPSKCWCIGDLRKDGVYVKLKMVQKEEKK